MKKHLAAGFIFVCLLLCPALAAEGHSGSLDMPKLTKEEIAQLLADNPLGFAGYSMAQNPSTAAPYALGQVSDAARSTALARFNALRRLAGLDSVALDEDYSRRCQYGAVLLAATGSLSHHPSQPADMDDDFYAWAHNGTSCSNIYQGTGATLPQAVEAFFDDSDAANLPKLGHRRWMLNPTMAKTGLGFSPSAYAYGATAYNFATLWAFDRSGAGVDYDFIAWPASGNFPSTLFASDQAWSVTLDPARYAFPAPGELTVTITGGGRSWSLSGSKSYAPSNAGAYLGTNADNYGVANAIIFRPEMEGADYAGLYTVSIQGLRTVDGSPAALTYQVDFFDPAQLTGGQATLGGSGEEGAYLQGFFTDVVAGSWYEEAVRYATERGLFNGVGGNRFAPDDPMTRAMVMTVLARLDGVDTTPYIQGETWELKGRRWAVTNHITDDLPQDSQSAPAGNVTLEELASMLYRYAGLRYAAGPAHIYHLAEMPDGDTVSNWAATATNWAVDAGILIGDDSRLLNPQRPATRAQVAIILQRFLTLYGL